MITNSQVRLGAGLKVKRLAVPFQGEATVRDAKVGLNFDNFGTGTMSLLWCCHLTSLTMVIEVGGCLDDLLLVGQSIIG